MLEVRTKSLKVKKTKVTCAWWDSRMSNCCARRVPEGTTNRAFAIQLHFIAPSSQTAAVFLSRRVSRGLSHSLGLRNGPDTPCLASMHFFRCCARARLLLLQLFPEQAAVGCWPRPHR